MSYSYEYDESGLASSYLALSFLIPVTLVYTYKVVTERKPRLLKCSCCRRSTRWSIFPKFMLFMLFGFVAYFVNNIRTIKLEVKKDFDPLEVLGVSLDASKKVIKRKMQTLLMKYAVSKAPEGKKEEYEKKCMDISKAYVIMKNKDSFNSWLNTESKSGEIMAIPDVIMKNALVAFLVYCIILGVALPLYAFRKWKMMRFKNRLGVEFKSMEEFLKYFNEELRRSGSVVRSLQWILSQSVEFQSVSCDGLGVLRDLVGTEYGYPLPDPKYVNDGFFVLCDILFRTGQASREKRMFILEKSLLLVDSMKYIAFTKGYVEVLKGIYTLQAMIVQGVFDEEFYLLQYPSVGFRDIYLKKGKTPELNIPKVKIEEFVASVKCTGISQEDASDVEEEEEEIVQKENKAVFNIPKGSLVTVKISLSTTNSGYAVHSHCVEEPLDHSWTAFISLDNVLHKKMVKITEEKKEIEFEFNTHDRKRSTEIKLYVLDGFYLKNNLEETITIKYV